MIKKAQTPLIEEILLFFLGFLIMIGYLYLNDTFKQSTSTYFADLQSELYINSIDFSLFFLKNTNLTGYIKLNLPKRIYDKDYQLYKEGDKGIVLYIPETNRLYSYNLSYKYNMSVPYLSTSNYMLISSNSTQGSIDIRGE